MRTTLFALSLLVSAAASAQTSEFGLLIGGSKKLVSGGDNFTFGNSVREIYYGVQLEPGTVFRIKAGTINAPLSLQSSDGTTRADIDKGKIEHVEGLVDYRFSEAFGSTGIFAGAGLYRQSGNIPSEGQQTETNYGFSGGVNGEFPLSRRVAVMLEATYHWINYRYAGRYVTATGGLRFSF